MPALVAFGRKWKLGSDDFIFTALVDTVIKAFWLAATVVVYIRNESLFQPCKYEARFNAYFCALILTILVPFIIDVAVVIHSGKGAIMDENSRRWVPALVYLRLGWELFDIGFNIVGTLWTFGETFVCLNEVSPYTYSLIRRYVICNWISIGVIILLLKIFYDPFGKLNSTKSLEIKQCTNKYDLPLTRLSAIWEKKFKVYTCFWGKGKSVVEDEVIREGFVEAGRLVSYWFHGTELVTTDIIAGLIALFAKEKRLRQQLQYVEISPRHKLKQTDNVITRQPCKGDDDMCANLNSSPESEVHLLRHYLSYGCSVYGWKGLVLDKFNENPARLLWQNAVCCGCLREPYQIEIVDDDCCFCNVSALKHWLPDIKDKDLVYVSCKCDYFEVPFFVALDHCTQAIVVALRGSFGMKDLLADCAGMPTPFTIEDGDTVRTFLAHHGMLLIAQYVKKKLERLKILSKLKELHPSYKVVLVGNSLGGSSAAILGMLLRAQYSDLRVFNFNSPGGVMSLEAARWCEPFTITVTFGIDWLARIGVAPLLDLKERVQEAVRDCSTPKYKIFASLMSSWCCGKMDSGLNFYSDDESTIGKKQNKTIQSNTPNGFDGTSKQKQPEVGAPIKTFSFPHTMYMPGRILYITENARFEGSSSGSSNSFKYEQNEAANDLQFNMRWADRNEFLKIVVGPKMCSDHSHVKLMEAFDECLAQNTHL